jgi:L-threonylcarbamoyladenylate synthase
MDELGGWIPLIVNGGPATHGIESTVVAVRNGTIEILRPGPITEEMICGIGFQPMPADATTTLRSPGQLPSHYAPRTPLRLTADLVTLVTGENQRIGLLAWNRVEPSKFAAVRELSQTQDLREAAANLFRYLRELDDAKLDLIVAELVPNKDLGIAINDRLRRAAQQ